MNDNPAVCDAPPALPADDTDSEVCMELKCYNGGTAVSSGKSCQCKCTQQWQGVFCKGKNI